MRRPAPARAVIPAVILSLSLLTACGGPASQPQPSPSSASPSSAAATATESTTAAASPGATGTSPVTPPPSASWTTYTTAAGDLSFDLPSTWNIKDPAGELAEGGGAFAEVTSEDGRLLATLRTNMATGSTCTEKYPYSILESQDMPQLTQYGMVPRY
ncbi:MAG: hypothetical protein ACLGIS_15000, partial [Actinomycetes bacterium]